MKNKGLAEAIFWAIAWLIGIPGVIWVYENAPQIRAWLAGFAP